MSRSYDDLAFISSNNNVSRLYCRDCDEVVEQLSEDGRRCLVCGCALETQASNTNEEGTRNIFQLGHVMNSHNMPQTLQLPSAEALERIVQELFSSVTGGDPSATGGRRAAAEDAVNSLDTFIAGNASILEVAFVVEGIQNEVIAIASNFGPCNSIAKTNVVLANPIHGASDLLNAEEMKGNIVLFERGVCPFAQKSVRAQTAGAIAVLIVQTADVWPYTMTDSNGDGKDLCIPTFMLSCNHGKGFISYLQKQKELTQSTKAEIIVRQNARECAICQMVMALGMKITRMKCQHSFHTDCLHEWLKVGNTCPICRMELPIKNATGSFSDRYRMSAQERGDFSWNDWFS